MFINKVVSNELYFLTFLFFFSWTTRFLSSFMGSPEVNNRGKREKKKKDAALNENDEKESLLNKKNKREMRKDQGGRGFSFFF